MARLLIAILATTSCAALNAPRARALKVTGGGLDIQKVGTALIGLEGLVGMIAPEAACKQYGYTPSADDTAFKRYTSAWLAALALLLPRTVNGTGHTGSSRFAPLAPSVFCAARQNAVLRRSPLRPT